MICSLKIYPSHHHGVKHETMTVYDLNLKSRTRFKIGVVLGFFGSVWKKTDGFASSKKTSRVASRHHTLPDVNHAQATHADLFPSTAGTYANVNSVEATVISCGWKEVDKKVGFQNYGSLSVDVWVFPKNRGYPQIIHFNKVFHYKPSNFGVSLFLETPI